MVRDEPIGRTLRNYKGERGGLELSYLKENGEETWTLLDNIDGHRNFKSGVEAEREFDLRLGRRLQAMTEKKR